MTCHAKAVVRPSARWYPLLFCARRPGARIDRQTAGTEAMNAIKAIRKHLEKHPDAPSSKALARLVAALAEEKSFSLAELYAMDYDAFEMALELLRDWRLDRYYASRLKLFDFALNAVIQQETADSSKPNSRG
jgi:hypothetical protein